jgi:hypothetical protein
MGVVGRQGVERRLSRLLKGKTCIASFVGVVNIPRLLSRKMGVTLVEDGEALRR